MELALALLAGLGIGVTVGMLLERGLGTKLLTAGLEAIQTAIVAAADAVVHPGGQGTPEQYAAQAEQMFRDLGQQDNTAQVPSWMLEDDEKGDRMPPAWVEG